MGLLICFGSLLLSACGSNPPNSAKGLGFDPVASPKFSYPFTDTALPSDCTLNP